MQSLEPPDSHYLIAAYGWIELGNFREATAELEQIHAALRRHPEVLQARWMIHAGLKDWETCVEIARETIAAAADSPAGWINQSNALYYLKRTQEAYDRLVPATKLFPGDYMVPYNLACYACQLGRLEEAAELLKHAMSVAKGFNIRKMALSDPDLTPLRQRFNGLPV